MAAHAEKAWRDYLRSSNTASQPLPRPTSKQLQRLRESKDLTKDIADRDKQRARVFPAAVAAPTRDGETTRSATDRGTNDRRYDVTWRAPTPTEQATYRRVARQLRKAKLREPSLTQYMSESPPGSLDTRLAMQEDAYQELGIDIPVRPYRSMRVDETPEPDLAVGFLVDISGSMKWATELAPSIAWCTLRAVRDVGGRTAAARFGKKVHALFHPGVLPNLIPAFSAPDGGHAYTEGLLALDGALNLSGSDGVRIVFVFSDGGFGPQQCRRGSALAERMHKRGVRFVWVAVPPAVPRAPCATLELESDEAYADLPRQVAKTVEQALKVKHRHR